MCAPATGRLDARTTTSVVPQTTLRFHGADLAGRKFGFDLPFDRLAKSREGFLIGRDADQCDAVLLHPTVSRRHARLVIADEHPADRGPGIDQRHGGRRRGRDCRRRCGRLQAGARLRIGDIELVGRLRLRTRIRMLARRTGRGGPQGRRERPQSRYLRLTI